MRPDFEAMFRDLAQQREMVTQVAHGEIPALRMEMALLRADMQAMEERLSAGRPDMRRPGAFEATYRAGDDGMATAAAGYMGAIAGQLGFGWGDSSASEQAMQPRTASNISSQEKEAASLLDQRRSKYQDRFGDVSRLDFKASAWDCTALVALHGEHGVELVGRFNMILTWIIFFANLVIQVVFIMAVYSMVEDNLDDLVEPMKNRRLVEGQDYMNMDFRTISTKTEQLCNLQSFDRLEAQIDTVKTYLNLGEKNHGGLNGYTICFLAMLIWILDVTKELRESMDLMLAIVNLPRTSTVRTNMMEAGALEIHSIAGVPFINKFVAIVLAIIPRIGIALCLLVFGLSFLANTIKMDELILNAVALEIINNIDELLFVAISPRRLMAFVQEARVEVSQFSWRSFFFCVEPEKRDHRIRSVPLQTGLVLGRMAVIIGFWLYGWHMHLAPVVSSAELAFSSVCEHDTNFTYAFHPMTNLPVFAHVDPYQESQTSVHELQCFYAARYELLKIRAGFPPQYSEQNHTLQSLVNGTHELCQAGPFDPTPLECPERREGLRYFSNMKITWGDSYYQSYDCRDQDVAFMVLRETCMSNHWKSQSGSVLDFFEDIRTCQDLQGRCHETVWHNISLTWFWQLEKVCPKTCGKCRPEDAESSAMAQQSISGLAQPVSQKHADLIRYGAHAVQSGGVATST